MEIIEIKDSVVVIESNKVEEFIQGEIILFGEKTKGYILSAEEKKANVIILNNSMDEIQIGVKGRKTNSTFTIDIPNEVIGHIWNVNVKKFELNDSLKHEFNSFAKLKASDVALSNLQIEPPISYIDSRKEVNRPMDTGIFMLDTTIPIGRGQRQLIIGDRQTGKTSIALDTILSQKGKKVICIYVAIGKKKKEVVDIYTLFGKKGALDYTMIFAATASDTPIQQYLIPYVATTVAEKFKDEGHDVLIVYDDLSKHAKAYRTLSLLVGMSPGREAYPGDIFYIHSRLLERSGSFNEKFGGGSITSLPIIETQLDVITNYIETNLISITDGQIVTSTTLRNKGIRPSVDVGNSVSRVGSKARFPILSKESSHIKGLYSQYVEIKDFIISEDTLPTQKKEIYKKGQILESIFKQINYEPYDYAFTWALSVLFNNDIFENVKYIHIASLIKNLNFFSKNDPFTKSLLKYAFTKEDYKFMSNTNEPKLARSVIHYFLLLSMAPVVKKFANYVYRDDDEMRNKVNINLMDYPMSSFKLIDFGNSKLELSKELETQIIDLGRL